MSNGHTSKPSTLPPVGTPVWIHRNLQNGLWSVTDPRTRRVIAHVPAVAVADAAPKVSAATCRRIREAGRRRVGAWITGTIAPLPADLTAGQPLRFNPHRGDAFTLPDGSEWSGSAFVTFTADHGCGFTR